LRRYTIALLSIANEEAAPVAAAFFEIVSFKINWILEDHFTISIFRIVHVIRGKCFDKIYSGRKVSLH
jgi:hypothetical protein